VCEQWSVPVPKCASGEPRWSVPVPEGDGATRLDGAVECADCRVRVPTAYADGVRAIALERGEIANRRMRGEIVRVRERRR
jgi:hypothetical protein